VHDTLTREEYYEKEKNQRPVHKIRLRRTIGGRVMPKPGGPNAR